MFSSLFRTIAIDVVYLKCAGVAKTTANAFPSEEVEHLFPQLISMLSLRNQVSFVIFDGSGIII